MKCFLLFLVIFKLFPNICADENFSISLVNIVRRALDEKKEPGLLPTTDDLFQMGKNLLGRYPFELLYSAISDFCTDELKKQRAQPMSFYKPNIFEMNYVLKVKDQNIFVPLNEPQKLYNLKEFNPRQPLVIMITGWTTSANKPTNVALDVVYAAYRCRGNFNFVSIDTGRFINTLYTWSAVNTEEIGRIIADSLKYFVKSYPIENIHVIGHSLGSHIAGSVGRNLRKHVGKSLPRITSLDPANPCFTEKDLSGLTRNDAVHVDVIHTNPGGLGIREAIGDSDFYPTGLHPHPVGCFSMVCAHLRAPEFYAETVYPGNEKNFLAVECGALLAMNTHYCSKREYAMGFATPQNIQGIFFLSTNEQSPYGLNATKDFKPVCNE